VVTNNVGHHRHVDSRLDGPKSAPLDPKLTLETLHRELGVKRLLLEGGGGANGTFLRAGLVDEISLAVCPAVDGAKGAPSVFDSPEQDSELRAPIAAMSLESSEVLDGGTVWLRYRVRNDTPDSL